jgi:molecular chaperone GrpE
MTQDRPTLQPDLDGPADQAPSASAREYQADATGAPPQGASANGRPDAVVFPEEVPADEVEIVSEGVAAEAALDERSPEELRAALADAEQLRDTYLDQAQRSRAEYANLKRRSEEALSAALDRGAERLLGQLLGVLDNFGYVMDATAEDDESQLAKGVRMVHAELFNVLEAAGLEPIPGVGAVFDPLVHEALLSEESEEPLEQPVVTEVLRRGYRFKGRTLRPASVKVAR